MPLAPRYLETPLATAVRRGIWAAASLAVPGLVLAAPQGGQVVAGSASIAQQGTKTTITQSTAKSAIDWQSFSIGANEYVQFVQPGTSSVTLNRVVGNDPSQLLGQMSANGQVFLVNPNGVYFGPNAVIDVAGLLATTFDISNDDFMAGNYRFARVEGRDPAAVVNDGAINADGGYVILAGDGVVNHGLIEARLGDIVLSASERINLDLGGDGLISYSVDGDALTEIAGVENTGELYADGGRVFMTAKVQSDLLPTAVNHEGLVQARTVEERDGLVYLGGAGGDVMIAGAIDADAGELNADGGTVRILSDRDITLRDGAIVTARGQGTGDGGNARLIAAETLAIEPDATVKATGGEAGEGGFIEVSGHENLRMRGEVDPGRGGTLLIDPSIINICGGTCSSAANGTISSSIREGTIEGALGSGIDVVLVASNSIIGTGLEAGINVLPTAGAGNLTLGIGQVTATDPGSEPSPLPFSIPLFSDVDSVVDCATGGLCTGSGSGAPNFFRYDPNVQGGLIQLTNFDQTPGGIIINGRLEIWAGLNGTIHAGSMRAAGITVEGNILSIVARPSYTFSMEATSFGVDVSGTIKVDNPLGTSTVQILGEGIRLGSVENGSGSAGSGVNSLRNTVLDAGSGSLEILGLLKSDARGASANGGAFVYAIAGGRMAFQGVEAWAEGVGQANIFISGGDQIAPKFGAMNLSAVSPFGDATVVVGAKNGLNVASVLAAAGGGSADVTLSAGSGAFLMNGGGIAALDFYPFDPQKPACGGTGGPTCFTDAISTDGVAGLTYPDFPTGTGTANISITGATVDIRTPFRSQPNGIFGAQGFLGAVGGQGASINVAATNGRLLLGSTFFASGVNKPFLFAQSQNGPAKIDLQATDGPIEVQRTVTPLISSSGAARYFTLYADALGSGAANVNLTAGGSTGGDILVDGGIFSRSVLGRSQIFVSANEALSINGLIHASAGTYARVLARSLGSGDLLVTGDFDLLSSGLSDLGLVNNGLGITNISGDITLRGARSDILVINQLHDGSLLIDPGATISALGSSDRALVRLAGSGLVQVDGDVSASGNSKAVVQFDARDVVTNGAIASAALGGTSEVYMSAIRGVGGRVEVNGRITADWFGAAAQTGISATSLDVDALSWVELFGTGALNLANVSGNLALNSIDVGSNDIVLDVAGQAFTSGTVGLLTARSLDITAIGGVSLNASVNDVAISNTGGGSISFSNDKSLNVSGLTAGGANVNLATAVGDLTYSGTIDAVGQTVTLSAAGTLTHTGTAPVRAQRLNADATGGIDLVTEVAQLNVVNSGVGGAFVENTGAVDVIALNGGSGDATLINAGAVSNSGIIRASNGSVTVQASSPITISQAVTAGSDILIETLASAGDDTLKVNAIVQSTSGDVNLVAGGENLELFGATLAGDHVGLHAPGGLVRATAASTVDANSLTVQAGTSIDLSAASLTLRNGVPTDPTQQFGDAQMLSDFAALGGTVPSGTVANASFVAPNGIILGNVDFFGDYMYLKSDSLVFNNAIGTWLPGTEPTTGTVNPNVVVQMTPHSTGQSVIVEELLSSSVPGETRYSNSNHFSLFPGTTLLVGNSLFGGPVSIGAAGTVNIGGQNFLVASTGGIAGLGNIISTGLVGAVGVTTALPAPPPPSTVITTTTGAVTTLVQQTTSTSDPAGTSDPGGTTIPEETVEANLPPEEQEFTSDSPIEEPIDFIALLEQQPLIEGQVDVNGIVLACQ